MKPYRTIRALSAAEDLFWRPDVVCPLNSVGSILIEGEFSYERFRLALDKVQRRHPLLQASVKRRLNRPYFVSGAPPVPVERLTMRSDQLRAFEQSQADLAMDSEHGPLMRVAYVDLGEQQVALVFSLHHAIFDGRSVIVFARDVLKHYLEPELEPVILPAKPSFFSALPSECRGLTGYRHFKRLQKQLAPEFEGITADLQVDHSTPIEQRTKVFDFLFVDRATTQQLLDRTRKEKTTLHAILSVAMASAIAEDLGKVSAKFAIVSPMDVSTKLEVKFTEDIMLATSAVTCSIAIEQGQSPWDAARAFRSNLQAHTREKQHLLLGPMMMKLYSLMAWFMSLGKNGAVRLVHAFNKASGFALSYTTMGDIGVPSEFSDFKIRKIYCMPGYTTNTPLIAFSSIFNGELVWAFGGFKEQIGAERLNKLMRLCDDKLRAALLVSA